MARALSETIVTATVLVTGASLWAAPRVGFDYNVLNLQADGAESVVMAGFGSLLVAHHRSVWSLGLLLVIGSAATLTASLVVLPTLVRLGGERWQSPAADQPTAAATVTSAAS